MCIEEKLICDKGNIEKLYKELGTVAGVATYFNKSYNTMVYWFKKYEVPFVTHKSLFMELKDTHLSDRCRSIILGTILGDGYVEMTSHSNKNARLCVSHCERQKPYLEWMCNELKPFSTKVKLLTGETVREIKGRSFVSTPAYYFKTVSHPDLGNFRTEFYNYNKTKVITESNVKNINELSLLVWYLDDGSLHIDKRDGCLYINMATNGFSYEEQLILMEVLSKFFDGSIRTYQHSNKDRGDYYIRLYGTKHILKLLKTLSSIAIPPGMEYKFDPQRLGVKPLFIG